MKLTTRALHSYRRSLKSFMGYVAENHWSDTFNCSAVTVLGEMLDQHSGQMSDFLQRYPHREREQRRQAVRYVILVWLADLAL